MEIAVFGASGTIGSRIVDEALRRGHRVTALARDLSGIDGDRSGVTAVSGDVLDPGSVAAAATGKDVVVSAVGGGDGPGHHALIEPSARTIVRTLRALDTAVPRFVMVGGAGSLRTPDGGRVWDAPGLPDGVLAIMHSHGDALEFLRTVDDIAWTSISPASQIEPGERTGRYRTALDDLVVDTSGTSRISAEDYAVALLDEVESPAHTGERFTVGD